MKKFLGLDIWQWIIVFLLIILEKCNLITFANAVMIIIIFSGLELIIEELRKIRERLEYIDMKPYVVYKIKTGDKLEEVAKQYNTSVRTILEDNKNIAGENLIFPGQIILIRKYVN